MNLQNMTIIRPDWETQAFCLLYDGKYILMSYNTAICCVHDDGKAIVVEFNPCYRQSVTTSRHFRWFMRTIPYYMLRKMQEFPKRKMRSTREFMDYFGTRTEIPYEETRTS